MIDVGKLVEQVLDSHSDEADELKLWLDKLYNSFDTAERTLVRNFYTIYVLWIVGFALGSGFVVEASVSGVKIGEIQLLLVGIPPLLGITYYRMSLANTATIFIERAIEGWYKHYLPKIHEADLVKLTLTPSFTIIERFISTYSSSKLTCVWDFARQSIVFLLPVCALFHVSFLLWMSGVCSAWVAAVSSALGFCFWLRGRALMGPISKSE